MVRMSLSPVEEGSRIRLIQISDPYTKLARGSLGTVVAVDDLGTVHVKWDDGSSLGLLPCVDIWEAVDG